MHASPGELGGPRTLGHPSGHPLTAPRFPRSPSWQRPRATIGVVVLLIFSPCSVELSRVSLFYVDDLVVGNVRPHDKDGEVARRGATETRLLYTG